MKTLNNKGISTQAIILIVALVIIAGGLIWWGMSRNTNTNQNSNINNNANTGTNTNSNQNINITTDPVTGWNIYTNSKYGYRLKFPKEWRIVQRDDEQDLPTGVGIWTASIRNYFSDDLEYHPQPGEITISVYIYITDVASIQSWFNNYQGSIERDLYEKKISEETLINERSAIIEMITTGKQPAIPVDTEWLDGKIANYYIKNNQQVLELSAMVWIEDEKLLDTADQIARSLTFVK